MCCMHRNDCSSRESGVLYTVEPDAPASGCMHLAAIKGLGELLVSGQATPATARIDKRSQQVTMLDCGQVLFFYQVHQLVERSLFLCRILHILCMMKGCFKKSSMQGYASKNTQGAAGHRMGYVFRR